MGNAKMKTTVEALNWAVVVDAIHAAVEDAYALVDHINGEAKSALATHLSESLCRNLDELEGAFITTGEEIAKGMKVGEVVVWIPVTFFTEKEIGEVGGDDRARWN